MKKLNNSSIASNAGRLVFTLLIGASLTACGGGGNSGNSSQAVADTAAAAISTYSGNRDIAILNSANTLKFADVMLGTSDLNSIVGRAASNETTADAYSGILSIAHSLTNLANTQRQKSNLANRSVSGSEQCARGGSYSGNGEVDDDGLGWITYNLNNCVSDDGVTLNGQMTMYVDSDGLNNVSSYTLTFSQLSAMANGVTTIQTGNLRYYEVYPPNGVIRSTLTIFSTNSNSSEEYLLDEVVTENGSSSDYVSGKIYISDEGYVTLNSSNDFSFITSTNLPLEGAMFMQGGSNSRARITNHSSISYTLDIDSDGDGVYDSSQVRDVQ